MGTVVFAFSCHPDDIEFMMSGTLFLLKDAGCELHYMNLANGSCGTEEYGYREIVALRKTEAENASDYLGAGFHESLVDDLDVFYEPRTIRRVAAIVREVAPDIMLLPSPQDYMEDHMNTARIGITAAFTRSMPNYPTLPPVPPVTNDVTLYHALPYGLTDWLRQPVEADYFVDVSSVMDRKARMLEFHQTQKVWLDRSQGLDSYLNTMREMSRKAGKASEGCEFAEGWRRHSHLGFSRTEIDPLAEILASYVVKNPKA